MRTVNIHEAKTHLSRLIKEASEGEPFVIAKAGKPMVTVAAIEKPPEPGKRRLGFAPGLFKIPDDFNEMGQEEIEKMFYGGEE